MSINETRARFFFSFLPTGKLELIEMRLRCVLVAGDGLSLEVELIQVYPINGDVYLDNIFIGESSFATNELQSKL